MTKKYFFLLLVLIPSLSWGQKAKISFEHQHHNFDTIREQDGKVAHTFRFSNTGDKHLIIRHVETPCGCTAPRWQRKPIPPGKRGTITITYNPKGRYGHFSQKIILHTNATPPCSHVSISGNIVRSKETK